MKQIAKIGAAAALAAAALGMTVGDAAAAVACNGAGECWHVRRAYTYPPAAGVVIHPNGWRWGPRERFTWRDHPGRGYWRNGVWVTF